MATTDSERLRGVAERIVAALPASVVEAVLTGSVSRGVADAVSDVEMLLVTEDAPDLDGCFALAAAAGLESLDSWGPRDGPDRRVFGMLDGTFVELIWWPRAFADAHVPALLDGASPSSADALVHGVPLRTCGLLAAWRARLADYPPALAARLIETAAQPWGGFAPAGVWTLLRPGDPLVLAEWLTDGADRALTIVYALNHVWRPSTKRLAARVAELPIQPPALADRLTDAVTTTDPRRALLGMTELQLDTVSLCPPSPNVDRARPWLAAAAELLRAPARGR